MPDSILTVDTGLVRTYGQYCPISRGAEILAERSTPLIIRNLYLGAGTSTRSCRALPGSAEPCCRSDLNSWNGSASSSRQPSPTSRAAVQAHRGRSRPVRGLPVSRITANFRALTTAGQAEVS